MARSARIIRKAAVGALFALAAGLPGCAASAGSGSGHAGYRDHYEAGRYQMALASARASAGGPGGSSDAALVAGLSAEAMRDDTTARQWLEPIARGSGDTAARARAGLALIELRTGDPLRAARELEASSAQFTGPDGREASRVAADAYERAGRPADAERLRRRAAGMYDAGGAGDPTPVAGGYTLQIGAYSTRSRATQRVAEISTATRSAGLGEPRVEMATRDGRVLYLIQVGRFRTQDDANRAMRTFGVSSIVAAVR